MTDLTGAPRPLTGGAKLKVWSETDSAQLLSYLQYRAKLIRTAFGGDEAAISAELELINSHQPSAIQLSPLFLSGIASAMGSLPRSSLSTGSKRRLSKSVIELEREIEARGEDVIHDVLGPGTVALVAGDSGIGKSPLLTQMGLCVASGLPFLNQPVTQGDVLLVDYENGKNDLVKLAHTISQFLGLDGVPDSFSVLHHPSSPEEVEAEIRASTPRLVLIDAVRGFDPSLEDKNSDAGARLTELQGLAESTGASIMLLHHLRKYSDEFPPKPLERDDVMHWLQQVSGPRALVNQTHTRIAIEAYSNATRPGDLILKGHFKVAGAFGPWYIERRFDEEGQPVGYVRSMGVRLLSEEHKVKFGLLPDAFQFATAVDVFKGASRSNVTNWLRRLEEAGMIVKEQAGRSTRYRKIRSTSAMDQTAVPPKTLS